MELTNKVHYLLTEYNTNVRPIILQIINYATVLEGLSVDVLAGSSFDYLNTTEKGLILSELSNEMHGTQLNLKGKILTLALDVQARASALIVSNSDHVVDMSSNVEDDVSIGELTAQTNALITTVTGMNGIAPGGPAGAALVAAENIPTLNTLSTKTQEKLNQIATAEIEVAKLANAVHELENFAQIISTLKLL